MGKDHNDYIRFLEGPWTMVSAALGMGVPIVFLLALLARRKPKKAIKNKIKEA
jgi:hypothetical protein